MKTNHLPMITMIIISSFLLFCSVDQCYGQAEENPRIYGIKLSSSITSFDSQTRLNLQANFERNNKAFELGLLLTDFNQIAGGEFHYKRFLSKNNDFFTPQNTAGNSRLYLFYNLVYNLHDPVDGTPDFIGMKYDTTVHIGKKEPVATLEHYLGLGVQLKISQHLYLDGSASFGAYLGKPDYQGSLFENLGIYHKNEGLGVSLRLGLAYCLSVNGLK